MSKQEFKFLNVVYKERGTRIDVTKLVDLSQVQDAIKETWANALARVDAPQIMLLDKEGKHVDDLDKVSEEYFKKLRDGGHSLEIKIAPVGRLGLPRAPSYFSSPLQTTLGTYISSAFVSLSSWAWSQPNSGARSDNQHSPSLSSGKKTETQYRNTSNEADGDLTKRSDRLRRRNPTSELEA